MKTFPGGSAWRTGLQCRWLKPDSLIQKIESFSCEIRVFTLDLYLT